MQAKSKFHDFPFQNCSFHDVFWHIQAPTALRFPLKMQARSKFHDFHFPKSLFYCVFWHIQERTLVKLPPTMFSLQKLIIFMPCQMGICGGGPLPRPKKVTFIINLLLQMGISERPLKTMFLGLLRGVSFRWPPEHQRSSKTPPTVGKTHTGAFSLILEMSFYVVWAVFLSTVLMESLPKCDAVVVLLTGHIQNTSSGFWLPPRAFKFQFQIKNSNFNIQVSKFRFLFLILNFMF